MTTVTQTIVSGTDDTLMSSDLNTLASGASVVSSVAGASGVITLTSAGYIEGELELVCTSTSNMTANTTVLVWFLRAPDGTNYEDGSSSVTPTRNPDVTFSMRAANSQRITKRCKLPPGPFKVLLQQNSGQAFLSANTLKAKPYTNQFA